MNLLKVCHTGYAATRNGKAPYCHRRHPHRARFRIDSLWNPSKLEAARKTESHAAKALVEA